MSKTAPAMALADELALLLGMVALKPSARHFLRRPVLGLHVTLMIQAGRVPFDSVRHPCRLLSVPPTTPRLEPLT